jgi:hypothetical protein
VDETGLKAKSFRKIFLGEAIFAMNRPELNFKAANYNCLSK